MQPDRREALRAWVRARARHDEGGPLDDTTPLLAQRYLTSLQVPELLLYLEFLRGAPIDVEDLRPGHLRDVDTIARRFLDA